MTTPLPFDKQLIRFLANGEERRVQKPWGYELIMDTGEFLLKFIHINDGHQTSLQYHERKEEVIIPVRGKGHVVYEGVAYLAGDGPIHITPGIIHRSVGPIDLIEITTMDNEDVVRLEDAYGRTEA